MRLRREVAGQITPRHVSSDARRSRVFRSHAELVARGAGHCQEHQAVPSADPMQCGRVLLGGRCRPPVPEGGSMCVQRRASTHVSAPPSPPDSKPHEDAKTMQRAIESPRGELKTSMSFLIRTTRHACARAGTRTDPPPPSEVRLRSCARRLPPPAGCRRDLVSVFAGEAQDRCRGLNVCVPPRSHLET